MMMSAISRSASLKPKLWPSRTTSRDYWWIQKGALLRRRWGNFKTDSTAPWKSRRPLQELWENESGAPGKSRRLFQELWETLGGSRRPFEENPKDRTRNMIQIKLLYVIIAILPKRHPYVYYLTNKWHSTQNIWQYIISNATSVLSLNFSCLVME